MLRLLGLAALLAVGVPIACLLVGATSTTACTPGIAPAACLGGSGWSLRDVFGIALGVGGVAAAVFCVTMIRVVRRHWRLTTLLERTAESGSVADHEVGLVHSLHAPYVAGLAHPRIYCPADLGDRLSERELRAVVLHERHHQLSYAPARLVVLAAVASCLGCLGPCRSWVERRRAAIEIAADDHALRSGARRSELASALLRFGSLGAEVPAPGFASASELRLRHLTDDLEATGARPSALMPLLMMVGAIAAMAGTIAACLV